MRRRTWLIGLATLAVAGGGVFWLLTRPSVLPATLLGPHTANPENGRTMFNIGGCASCHATPVRGMAAKGLIPGSPRDIVVFNAGAALYAANVAPGIAEGVALARQAIADGRARAKLDEFLAFARRPRS